jgi:Tfp pilus assembly protein PilF
MNRSQIVTFGRIGRANRALRCSFLVVLAAAGLCCSKGERLPEPSSQEYRDTIRAFYVGLAALQAGAEAHAEEELKRASELAPGEPVIWANLGLLSLKQRDFDAAANRFQKAASLAPKNSRIISAQATLASSRGNPSEAITLLRRAVELDPGNLKSIYSLSQEVEREGGGSSDAEASKLLEKILSIQPDNLAALLDETRLAAKRSDPSALQGAIAKLNALAASWPPEAREQMTVLQAAAAGSDTRGAGTRVAFLRNVLVRTPEYRASLSEIKLATGEVGEPFTRFLKLPSPSPLPAPEDSSLAFSRELVAPGSKADWAGAVSLDGTSAPIPITANQREAHIKNQTLVFPGGASAIRPESPAVLALDYNYDFKMDLLLAGEGGLKLYRQEANGTFSDATSSLPASAKGRACFGAWAADIEMDGDLDIVPGPVDGPPVVLRNNGDSTFNEVHPFEGAGRVRDFAWADLDGDGDPDAVFASGDGNLIEFQNERGGLFRVRQLPAEVSDVAAIGIADLNGDGVLDLIAAHNDARIEIISDSGDGSSWKSKVLELASIPDLAGRDLHGRIVTADLDNNGGTDLVWCFSTGTLAFLRSTTDEYRALDPINAAVASVADLNGDGRLDLVGATQDHQGVRLINHGSKVYHWQLVRPHAATATGDQRINSFGIGGEMEIRSGLLFQKQQISGPVVHFGLGENGEADVLRIAWPNGAVQAEFDLKSDQAIVADQRLKGSCPSLFAFDGQHMRFVKDCPPWSPAIGLRINASQTASITQTEEWHKIRGDQLAARDGYYDLRITGELWETFYLDHYSLLVVDHPADTAVFVDERTSNPPPRLGLYVVSQPHPVKRALDDNGNDVTEVVRMLDGSYLDTFGRGQYQGVTRDHWVEIELDESAPRDRPLYLLAHGWMHPTDASINVAISQGSHAPPQALSIEVQDANGKWVGSRGPQGFPAGKNKTMVFDLTGVFREGAQRRLRLRTSMEVYWDALEWAEGRSEGVVTTARLDPMFAELRYRGFSVFTRFDKSSPEIPDYDRIDTTAQKWRDLIGYYTRFGDVLPLLESVDDRIVIMNAGDELALRFRQQEPPRPGWARDYILVGNGWIKDGDFNSMFSKTVLPLPSRDQTAYTRLPERLEDDPVYLRHRQDWQDYHTRYVTAESFQRTLIFKDQDTK